MNRAPSLKRLAEAFPQIEMAALARVRHAIKVKGGIIAIDRALDNHGVESIVDHEGRIVALYSNSGDTYAPTIIFCYPGRHYNGTYRLTTVGDFVETHERNHGKLS